MWECDCERLLERFGVEEEEAEEAEDEVAEVDDVDGGAGGFDPEVT
jgi:hypothetical protein